jgi:hypothetical protein
MTNRIKAGDLVLVEVASVSVNGMYISLKNVDSDGEIRSSRVQIPQYSDTVVDQLIESLEEKIADVPPHRQTKQIKEIKELIAKFKAVADPIDLDVELARLQSERYTMNESVFADHVNTILNVAQARGFQLKAVKE